MCCFEGLICFEVVEVVLSCFEGCFECCLRVVLRVLL